MNNIESILKTYTYEDGCIQRVQSVKLPGWDSLDFVYPKPSEKAFDQVCDLYEKFIVPKAPYLFGTLVFFSLPEDMKMPFPYETEWGITTDKETAAVLSLRKYIRGSRFEPSDEKGKAFVDELKERGFLRIIKGTRPFHCRVLCISNKLGHLSSRKDEYRFLSNAGFFTMDMFDIGSPYDIIGRPIGLRIKNGICLDPPLFEREALFVMQDGSVKIERPRLSDLNFEIDGKTFIPDINAKLFERPNRRWTDGKGVDLAIIGTKVIAVSDHKKIIIPSAGFVLQIPNDGLTDISKLAGKDVIYHGFEYVKFGIQAGNSAVINGDEVKGFRSYFSNIRNPFALPIPPSLYPRNYEKDRAPRMALGCDKDGRPVIVWAEGPGKFDDLKEASKGLFSCGASLSEMAHICSDMGLLNAVNLDGGGSAQILLEGERKLLISDRHKEDNSEYERTIPAGLSVI